MDTLTERETEREDVPRRQDGSIDLNELARGLLEDCLNAVMSEQADELLGEGNRRNGYRERSLNTCVGRITLRIPKLREGTYFPDDVLRPYSRTDRAMVGAIAETYRLGLSHRKIERAASKLGFGELSSSAVSRMCSELDADVDELRGARFDMGFPYLWLDATYVKCRSDGRVQGRAVVTAIAAGSDGSRRFVGLDCVDTESRGSWRAFLLGLRRRGVEGVRCVTSDDHAGLVRAIAEVYPEASWQRCITHLERDVAGRFRRRADRARAMRAVSAVFKERDPGLVRAMYDRAVEDRRDREARRRAARGRPGGRAVLPGVPRRAQAAPEDEQRPGAGEQGDKAQDQRRPGVPLRGLAGEAGGRGVRRHERRVGGGALHGRRGHGGDRGGRAARPARGGDDGAGQDSHSRGDGRSGVE